MEINVNFPTHDSSDDDASTTGSRTPSSRLSIDDTNGPERTQCKYTGKVCMNHRAKKTNGKLHRLCEMHRIRANINQRNLQEKRRRERALMLLTPYPINDETKDDDSCLEEGWEDWVSAVLAENGNPPPRVECVTLAPQPLQPLPRSLLFSRDEPLMSPSQLTEEDVEVLSLLFMSSVTDDGLKHSIDHAGK